MYQLKGMTMNKDDEILYLKEQIDQLSRNYVTGLYGQRKFMQKIRKKVFDEEVFWLVMYDVDNLHEINRLKGMSGGDSLLREVANDLLMCEEPCCAFHIHGDEFFVVYSNKPHSHEVSNTTSCMICSVDYPSIDDMLDAVDAGLSELKKEHKLRRRDDV